jgi:hypothetical protein
MDSDPGVTHAEKDMIVSIPQRPDKQVPWAVIDAGHGIRSILQKIQDDLLELYTVSLDGREVLGELRAQSDAISLEIAQGQRNYLLRRLVQVQPLQGEFFLAEQSA